GLMLRDHPWGVGAGAENAHAPDLARLLRARIERPRGCRAAHQRDERAPPHSITSSARCWRNQGTSRPSAIAVLRLIASSYLVDCTGRSAGFSPLRMRSTYEAERRTISMESGPYDISAPSVTNCRKL